MKIVGWILLAMVLSAAPAAAYWWEGNWGAIAYGTNGASGVAVDYSTAGEARQAAFDACGGQCSQSFVFQRNCGAVAASAGGNMAWARNRWRDRAIARAVGQCRDGGQDCALVAWACTTH